jgi:hypothetical protein
MITECTTREPTDEEMTAARKALAEWQTPEKFLEKISSFAPLVKSSTLFNKTSAGFLRDAIPIAEFAKHRAVKSVRLVEQQERSHDGQFRHLDQTVDIEVTEVMEPGRRRGDEYRVCRTANEKVSDFDPNLGTTIATELSKAIQRKAEKKYATKPLLLVYLNISTGGRLGNEVEIVIEKLKAEYANSFAEICVLWANKLY